MPQFVGRFNFIYFLKKTSRWNRVPQIFPWRSNLLQSLAPTLIKLTCDFSNDPEDSDLHAHVCLIRDSAELCRSGPDLRMPETEYRKKDSTFICVHSEFACFMQYSSFAHKLNSNLWMET